MMYNSELRLLISVTAINTELVLIWRCSVLIWRPSWPLRCCVRRGLHGLYFFIAFMAFMAAFFFITFMAFIAAFFFITFMAFMAAFFFITFMAFIALAIATREV